MQPPWRFLGYTTMSFILCPLDKSPARRHDTGTGINRRNMRVGIVAEDSWSTSVFGYLVSRAILFKDVGSLIG